MTKKIFLITTFGLILTSCANEPTTRGNGSSYSATRAVEVVEGETQTYPRIALIIGNNNYQKNRKLTNAVPDARAMRDFFTHKGFRVVYAENADKNTMKSKINEFMSGLDKKSVSVIYYSGHATQDRSKETGRITNYILPINDTTLDTVTDYDRDAISMNYILSKADDINHGLNIAMLDACRTPIGRGGGSIQNISAEGVYLVYSTASGTTASDSGQFRKSFLKYAQSSMKLNDIFLGVKRDLIKTGQKPIINDETNGEVFYFSKPQPKPIEKPRVVERIVYRDRPQSVANSNEWITPTESICKNNGGKIDKNGCKANWNNANKICKLSGGVLPTKEKLNKIITDCGGILTSDFRSRDAQKNSENNNYHSCYKAKGFSSYAYWSATTTISDYSDAWLVDFTSGYNGHYSKTIEYSIRCVRGGQ